MNYFIEGIQGTGKSTLLRGLLNSNKKLTAYFEGDVSPLVPAWCAYLKKEDGTYVERTYPELLEEMRRKAVRDKDYEIVAYTQILTDIPNFHKDLERFSFYHGKVSFLEFERYIMKRFQEWQGDGEAFESSFFQNIIETLLLFYEKTDEEVYHFYQTLKEVLKKKNYRILYLNSTNVEKTIERIKKERTDIKGEEIWYPLVVRYLETSPYGKKHGLKGMEGLIFHLERRRDLEKKILEEVFKEEAIFLKERSDLERVLERYRGNLGFHIGNESILLR